MQRSDNETVGLSSGEKIFLIHNLHLFITELHHTILKDPNRLILTDKDCLTIDIKEINNAHRKNLTETLDKRASLIKILEDDLNTFQKAVNEGINESYSISHLKAFENTLKQLDLLHRENSKQAIELQTLHFIKNQLRLRNRELKEEKKQRENLEQQLLERDKAFETIDFLRQQLRSLKKEISEEREQKRKIIKAISTIHSKPSQQFELQLSHQYLDLYQEEAIYSGILESELKKKDVEIDRLKQTIDEQTALISQQKGEIHELEEKVSFYERLFREIRSAFIPLTSLIFRQSNDSIPTIGYSGPEKGSESGYSEEKTDHYVASIKEDLQSSQPSSITAKIIHFPLRFRKPKKKSKEIRWGKISILLMFFLLTTFGTTDLFSHFKPFINRSTPDLIKPFKDFTRLVSLPQFTENSEKRWELTYNKLKHQPIVVLDPGHGGFDTGARNKAGWCESDFTLDMCFRIEEYLNHLATPVILTRRSDRYLTLDERQELANRFPHSLLVSIHLNAHPRWSNSDARGFSVFYNDDYSYEAAERVYSSAVSILYLESYNKGIIDGRKFYSPGNNHLGLLKNIINPGILVETSFISHDADFQLMNKFEFRNVLASQIARGIADCKGLY